MIYSIIFGLYIGILIFFNNIKNINSFLSLISYFIFPIGLHILSMIYFFENQYLMEFSNGVLFSMYFLSIIYLVKIGLTLCFDLTKKVFNGI